MSGDTTLRIRGLALGAALALASTALAAGNSYVLKGAIEASHDAATCSLNFSKYGKVWTLRLNPEGAYAPTVNLFFSPRFGEAKTGEFPVKYDFRNSPATFGGSVTQGMDMYSTDTEGVVTITEFADRLKGSFALKAMDRKREQQAEAAGQFDCQRGEVLR